MTHLSRRSHRKAKHRAERFPAVLFSHKKRARKPLSKACFTPMLENKIKLKVKEKKRKKKRSKEKPTLFLTASIRTILP